MIEFRTGDILKADAEALVNTVNCVGIMGRGIALQFKNAFPDNFKAYAAACAREEVRPGRMFVVDTGYVGNPKYIINFPTKRHWRGKSRMEDIEAGLSALVRFDPPTHLLPFQPAESASERRNRHRDYAALAGLVEVDGGPYGITSNAVLPGWVRTEMAERSAREEAKDRGITADEVWEERAAAYPAGRVATPKEVAATIAFLASEESSGVSGEAVKGCTRQHVVVRIGLFSEFFTKEVRPRSR